MACLDTELQTAATSGILPHTWGTSLRLEDLYAGYYNFTMHTSSQVNLSWKDRKLKVYLLQGNRIESLKFIYYREIGRIQEQQESQAWWLERRVLKGSECVQHIYHFACSAHNHRGLPPSSHARNRLKEVGAFVDRLSTI